MTHPDTPSLWRQHPELPSMATKFCFGTLKICRGEKYLYQDFPQVPGVKWCCCLAPGVETVLPYQQPAPSRGTRSTEAAPSMT